MLFVTVFFTFNISATETATLASTTLYVCEQTSAPSEIPSSLLYSNLPLAIAALGDGGTIYVCGDLYMPTSIAAANNSDAHTLIKGYPGTKARLVFPASGVEVNRNITFDEITIKGAAKDESWTRAVGCTLEFAAGCSYEPSEPYTYGGKQVTSGIYIGHSKKYAGDAHYIFSAPDIEYNMIAPAALYSSGYDVNGDFTFDLNDGIFKSIFGGVRNGNNTASFQKIYGDVTYNINGGDIGTVATHNHFGGHVYGNIVFNINGGNYATSSKIYFGNSSTTYMGGTLNTADYSSSGNVAIVINAEELERNNSNISNIKITQATSFNKISKGTSVLVINNSEKTDYIPTVSVSNINHLAKINGGKALPVFEESDNAGNIGKFLGFDITADNKGYLPYVNGEKLTTNSDGYYTLPKSSNGAFVEVTFENPLEGRFFEVTFGESGLSPISAEGNTAVILPVFSGEKDGFCFAGWSYDGKTYASGEAYVVEQDVNFEPLFVEVENVKAIYVSEVAGDDLSSGATKYAPVKTLYQAVLNVDKLGAQKIVIMDDIISGNVDFTPSENHLTITGKDDTTDFGGSLVFTSSQSVRRPVTFENMALGCEAYQFIATTNQKVIFGDNLKAINDKGICTHLGSQYSAADKVDVEIKSGFYSSIFIGGAYLSSERVGLAGDARVSVSNMTGLPMSIGFDGYEPFSKNGTIDGSVEIVADGGSIAQITTTRLSGISGSLYLISHNSAIIPSANDLPKADCGTYSINVLSSDGKVRASVDENGKIRPGFINATSTNPNKAVRLTMNDGVEAIYDQGDISVSSGTYTVEFIEKSYLTQADIITDEPIFGHKAKKVIYATEQYFATGEWYHGDVAVDRFELDKEYSLVLTLTPCKAIDTSEFYDVAVNGNGAALEENDDGTFTVTYNHGALTTGVVRYVSQSKGNDVSVGSKEKPYATLKAAVKAVGKTGGVVYVMDSVNAGGEFGKNEYPVLVTGDGFPNAAIYLENNAGSLLNGDIIFDNIKMTMGSYSHYNDRGYKLTFSDGVSMDGFMLHLGTYSGRSVYDVNVSVGKNSSFRTLHLGGGYHTSQPKVLGDMNVYVAGKVSNLSYGSDAYLASQVDSLIQGNVLFTFDSNGSFSKMIEGARRLVVSDDTVFQFVFLNASRGMGAVPEDLVPANKLYTIYSGVGGTVLHAKDAEGKSISGFFDIVPDKGYSAIIKYNDYLALTSGGRYSLPANTEVNISYFKSGYPIDSYKFDLAGGKEDGKSFEIDENGHIHFFKAPIKKNCIFEGWYSDAEYTKLVKEGDYMGGNISLYAKFKSLPMNERDRIFAIRGVQMRIPNSSSNIQGLRFITVLDNEAIEEIADFSDKNSDMLRPKAGYDSHYGTVVIPTEILGVSELVVDGKYQFGAKTYTSRNAAGINIFSQDDKKTEYTVCLLNISPDKYEYAYTARPYITYYTRSGNLATLYGTPYSVDVMDTTFAALESGNESEETEKYMREQIVSVYASTRNIELLPTETLEYINEKTELYKNNVLNSENMSISGITGTKYYVSPNGSDSNNGTSPYYPWKSIAKVNATTLKSGDAVLFERGGEYRGKITATAGVTYSAYGTGAKPIINGSAQNYADPSLWVETDAENVYRLVPSVHNVGLMAFDHSKEIGVYDELVGTMRVSGSSYDGVMFNSQYDLCEDLQFYSNMSNGTLYLYSDRGNPGERFSSIELGSGGNLMAISSRKNVTVDNLDFRYGGSHGVGGSGGLANYNSDGTLSHIGGCANLTVTNCLFSWIGGSILSETTRYGNAVEIFGSVDGYHVENNWIYQIYDTGVTHQISGSSVGNTHMRDILYKDNLIEYCHWSIEFYNQNCECCESLATPKHSRIVEDVLSVGNIVRMGGYGWGSRIRKDGATLYNSFGLSRVASETRNFHAKDNIFFRCAGGLYRIYANASEDNLTFESNLWVQDYNGILSWYKNGTYRFDESTIGYIEGIQLNEVDTKGVYFYAP